MASQTPAQLVVHLDALVESKTHPIALRLVRPKDAARYADLIFAQDDSSTKTVEAKDIARSAELIAAHREKGAVPTALDREGRVVSGPPTMNMVVIVDDNTTQEGCDQIIGCGGYGAIKTWERTF